MKLGIFTDSHYSSHTITGLNKRRRNSQSLKKIKEAYDFFAAENCDLVICLGDLIDKEDSHQKEIDNLKEIDIYHYPQGEDLSSRIVVSISTDGKNWEELQLINQVSVYVRATMPATGDYYLQIKSKIKDFYIHQIKYTTEKCACFPYIKPE
jgi:hypothetical protein